MAIWGKKTCEISQWLNSEKQPKWGKQNKKTSTKTKKQGFDQNWGFLSLTYIKTRNLTNHKYISQKQCFYVFIFFWVRSKFKKRDLSKDKRLPKPC